MSIPARVTGDDGDVLLIPLPGGRYKIPCRRTAPFDNADVMCYSPSGCRCRPGSRNDAFGGLLNGNRVQVPGSAATVKAGS